MFTREEQLSSITSIAQFLETSAEHQHEVGLIQRLRAVDPSEVATASSTTTLEGRTRELLESCMQEAHIADSKRTRIMTDCMNFLSPTMVVASPAAHPTTNPTLWPRVLSAFAAMFSSAPPASVPMVSQAMRLVTINASRLFAQDIEREILSYLPLSERAKVARLSKTSQLFDSKTLREELLVDKFIQLIAIEGEDNQNKAEAMLKKYPQLRSKLIATPRDMRDNTRHFTQPMSAYAYAYWSGDTRIRKMLEKYMDEGTKANVYQQCLHIAGHGVDYELISNGNIVPNSTVSHSKHFDFQPLIVAYNAYIAAATPLVNAANWDDAAWADANNLWLNTGRELAKVPTHIAQEYCSRMPFYPLDHYQASLQQPDLKRTVTFYNSVSHRDESWFSGAGVNPGLGVSFSVLKNGGALVGFARAGPDAVLRELAAVAALCKARTDDDLKLTLDALKPAEPGPALSV